MSTFFASTLNRVLSGAILGLALLAGLLVLTVRSQNAKIADLRAERNALSAQVEAINLNLAAHDQAGIERAADTAIIAKAQKDLNDAIAAVPDTVPDAVAVALGCGELRRAGHLDADLPAACRPAGGSPPGPRP